MELQVLAITLVYYPKFTCITFLFIYAKFQIEYRRWIYIHISSMRCEI